MKTLASLLLISATFAGTTAYAASPNLEPNNVPFQGVYGHVDANAPTRAQIIAELQAAKAAGQVTFGDIDEPVTQLAHSTVTREQVRAEALAAREHSPAAADIYDYSYAGA
jgi:hypothetical protein